MAQKSQDHKSQEELNKLLEEALLLVDVGGVYFHHKNPSQLYRVFGLVLDEEKQEVCVCYMSLYGLGMPWSRPLSVWLSEVDTSEGMVPRFQRKI